MMRGVITGVLLLTVVMFSWAQAKKPTKPVKKQTAKPVMATMAASLVRGKMVYSKVCITCHQKDGGGVPMLTPPLIKTTYVLGDKTRLINIVLKGFNQTIEIDDEQYTNPMPAQANLTDQQIADVLTFVRNSFGNKATPVTTAEVKAVRARK